jgi:hypothetical protein
MRALYKFLGLSDATTEAAIALRRQTPVIEARAKQIERFQRRHKTGGKHGAILEGGPSTDRIFNDPAFIGRRRHVQHPHCFNNSVISSNVFAVTTSNCVPNFRVIT